MSIQKFYQLTDAGIIGDYSYSYIGVDKLGFNQWEAGPISPGTISEGVALIQFPDTRVVRIRGSFITQCIDNSDNCDMGQNTIAIQYVDGSTEIIKVGVNSSQEGNFLSEISTFNLFISKANPFNRILYTSPETDVPSGAEIFLNSILMEITAIYFPDPAPLSQYFIGGAIAQSFAP